MRKSIVLPLAVLGFLVGAAIGQSDQNPALPTLPSLPSSSQLQQLQQQLQQRVPPSVQINNGGDQLDLLRNQQDEERLKARQGQELLNLPPEPDIEFQDFVFSSLGYRLPIFGHNLFREVPSTFAPLDQVPVTPDYLIGPGDELLVRGWGQIDVNYRAVVDRTGVIYLPKVGSISVAGVRYDELHDHIKAAIARVFKNFEIDVTLGRLRSIQVFVVGQVRRPGSYTVSSLSTLVNALFASGGPSKRGSMRHIVLKRAGEKVGAAIVLKPGASAEAVEILHYAQAHLADFKVPQYVVFRTETLPRNPGGKILKKKLREGLEWGKQLW